MTCCEIVRYNWRFKTRVAQLQTHLWSTDLAADVAYLDWEATHAKAREDLLRAAVDWGRFETPRIWSATLPPEPRMLLGRAGFRVADRPRTIGHAHRDVLRRPMLLVRAVGCARPETSEWAIGGCPLLDLAS